MVRELVLFLSKDCKKSVWVPENEVVIEAISSNEWASLTFSGERHHLVIRWPGVVPDVDLDDAHFHLLGLIVVVERAAWAAVSGGSRLTIDLLAIAEAKKALSRV